MWAFFTKKKYNLLNHNININELFINKIKEIRNKIYKIPNINYNIIEYNISENKINNLLSGKYVMENIVLNNLDHNIYIKWKNNTIYIKCLKSKFNKFINRLQIFLKVCTFIQENSSQNINLYLLLSHHKKYVDYNKIIEPKHVNSGYTNLLSRDVCIWREEEFEKVTFHELIHLFDKDHRHESINFNCDLNNLTHDLYYEAITDFKAIIINIIYVSLITRFQINLLLKYEYNFIYNQAKLIYNNLKNVQKQNTAAYSYFILKYFIFKYFIEEDYDQELLNDILDNNKNYDKLINKIKYYSLNESTNFVDFKSARMTLIELN